MHRHLDLGHAELGTRRQGHECHEANQIKVAGAMVETTSVFWAERYQFPETWNEPCAEDNSSTVDVISSVEGSSTMASDFTDPMKISKLNNATVRLFLSFD